MPIVFNNLDQELSAGVKKEIRSFLDKAMPNIINNIKNKLSIAVADSIKSSPEYQSVLNGELQGELGLANPLILDEIIDIWVKNIYVKYVKSSDYGRVNIGIIKSDYIDVLSSPAASFVYSTRTGNGVIEWLRWLLLEGDSIIVFDYDFEQSNRGRTGLGIMVRREGGGWRIPSEFAGTSTDNFVTRSLSNIENTIDSIVRQAITKGLS